MVALYIGLHTKWRDHLEPQEKNRMKNYKMTAVTLLALLGGVALQADNTQTGASAPAQKPQVVVPAAKAVDAVTAKLSADELAFAAKLNDQNRKLFTEKLSAEQRKVAMTAAKVSTAANAADEAVAKLVSGSATVEKKDRIVADAAETK